MEPGQVDPYWVIGETWLCASVKIIVLFFLYVISCNGTAEQVENTSSLISVPGGSILDGFVLFLFSESVLPYRANSPTYRLYSFLP